MKSVFLFSSFSFPSDTKKLGARGGKGEKRRGEDERRGAAAAMISGSVKTTSGIEANGGGRRVTRLEGWMHSAFWKIMRSYARDVTQGTASLVPPIAV